MTLTIIAVGVTAIFAFAVILSPAVEGIEILGLIAYFFMYTASLTI